MTSALRDPMLLIRSELLDDLYIFKQNVPLA